jgi:hypothetical protein
VTIYNLSLGDNIVLTYDTELGNKQFREMSWWKRVITAFRVAVILFLLLLCRLFGVHRKFLECLNEELKEEGFQGFLEKRVCKQQKGKK